MKETKFKQTEVGMIPSDWEVKTLGSLTDKCSYGVGAEARVYCGGVKYIRITDIDDESHRFSPSPITSPSFYQEKHIVQKNDLLVARTGASVGKSYLYDKNDGTLVYAGFLMKLNIFNADSKYVFYNTLTKSYWNWVASESARTGQPGLNLQQMKLYSIPIPPTIKEQQRIANALSDVDTLINNLEKLIAKKKNIKQGAMQQLLTGKKRLPGFAKSTNYKQSELGPIPEDWEVKSLGEISVINPASSNIIPDEFFYVDLESVSSGKLGKKQKIRRRNAPSRAQRQFEKNDILYQTVRPYQRNNLFVNFDSKNYIASTGYAIIRSNNNVDSHYIYQIIHLNNFVNIILDNCTGTSYPAINPKFLKTIPVIIPKKEEQAAIANVLSSMDKEIENLNTKLEKYRNLKTAMMQQLLTGKIRLIK